MTLIANSISHFGSLINTAEKSESAFGRLCGMRLCGMRLCGIAKRGYLCWNFAWDFSRCFH